MEKLNQLIAATRQNRVFYSSHGMSVDAAACAIRERALLDAKKCLEEDKKC